MKIKDLAKPLLHCPLCNEHFHYSSKNNDIAVTYMFCNSKKHNCEVKVANYEHTYASLRFYLPDSKYHLDIWEDPKEIFINHINDKGMTVMSHLLRGNAVDDFELKDFVENDLLTWIVFK